MNLVDRTPDWTPLHLNLQAYADWFSEETLTTDGPPNNWQIDEILRVAAYTWAWWATAACRDQCGRVIDFGCGSGYGSRILAQRGRSHTKTSSVLGLDVDPKAADPQHAEHFKFQHANVNHPWVSLVTHIHNAFAPCDVVVLFDFLDRIEQRDVFLTDLLHVCKPGTRVLVSVPQQGSTARRPRDVQQTRHLIESFVGPLQPLTSWDDFCQTLVPPMREHVSRGGDYLIECVVSTERHSDVVTPITA